MIDFCCDKCGRAFSVPESYTGRRASCKTCGAVLIVPNVYPDRLLSEPTHSSNNSPQGEQTIDAVSRTNSISAPKSTLPATGKTPGIDKSEMTTGVNDEISAAIPSAPPKIPVRIRRLQADAQQMQTVFQSSPFIRVVSASGHPPDTYSVEYHIRGLSRGHGGHPVTCDQHLVEIQLTREYPRQSPKCRMVTPIFHPNIEPAVICVGDHWTAAERLTDLVIRIGEMIAYQAYNIKSPLDGEAAMWADLNRSRFPIDKRDLRPPELT